MKKLTLDLNTLAVQTFVATPGASRGRGTVAGHDNDTISCWDQIICSGGTDVIQKCPTIQTRDEYTCAESPE